jgi:UDP-N-acetylglucosamine 2-epimerase
MTGNMLIAIEKVLLDVKPDALLVYGDKNSSLATSLAAVKLHIPVCHVEAEIA